ncbi:MAG TPA: Hsp20/alpha crystallin family protein [Patescibacteria group bacterium]|nr:Hsp20/alpha crystallin family protein [Patescibacteria group bacterium]
MSKSEIEKFFSDDDDFLGFGRNTHLVASDDDTDVEEPEGQLSIDMYQTDNDVVIKAPVAGVDPEDLEINVNEDSVYIRGKRHEDRKEVGDDYVIRECYWGSFARSQPLPVAVLADKADASINKKGVLTIRIPKAVKNKGKTIKVKAE